MDLLNNHRLALKSKNDWIKENKLVLNAKKTKNLRLNGRRNIQFENKFPLGRKTAESVEQYKH